MKLHIVAIVLAFACMLPACTSSQEDKQQLAQMRAKEMTDTSNLKYQLDKARKEIEALQHTKKVLLSKVVCATTA